jgi:heptosyltransferase-2
VSQEAPRRIAILAQWGIGDAVLLLPLLRGLKRAFPEASLELIGKPWLSDLLDGEGCCDRSHRLVPPWTAHVNKYMDGPGWRSFTAELFELRRGQFDWLIGTRFDAREVLQLRLLRARETFAFAAAGGRHWVTNDLRLVRDRYDALHRAAVSEFVLKSIVPDAVATSPSFRPRQQAQQLACRWLHSKGYLDGPVLAVHGGAGNPLRNWREPHFESVIKMLSVRPGMIVFIEGDDRKMPLNWLPVPHAAWRGSLSELKALLSICDVFLGTDSGVMHMAAAAGCRVVAAFGPGEPRWFRPVGEGSEIAAVEPMPCRPCLDKCIYSRSLCLDRLEDGVLAAALQQKLAEQAVAQPRAAAVFVPA